MKVQVRNGVFETNSSSTHAVSVCAFDINKHEIPETIVFETGDFGWEINNYTDVNSKASYLWTAVVSEYQYLDEEEDLIRIKAAFTKILNDAGVKNVYFKDAGYKTSEWVDRPYLDIDGYIDHAGDLFGWANEMIEEPNLLLGYLFNDESLVSTGNDNDDYGVNYANNAIFTIYKGN